MKRRLDVLDGLRGFAILLVFLNHIDSFYLANAVPTFFKPVILFLFTSGNLGVTFFFILSGFLMGYLYSKPNPKEFIERRYARIFPPFLVMAVCMFIFRLVPTTPLFARVFLMLSVALFVRLIWTGGVEKFKLGSVLISLFLLFQGVVAVWYGFIIMRHPAIWFDSLPFVLKQGSIFAANATLTLPLGNYIPLLDGVYWSLIPEMIFYLVYPFIFVPTVQMLHKKNKWYGGIFIFLLFPFFFGLSLLFKHSQGLTMLFVEYFIYFCGGIFIANILNQKSNQPSNHFIAKVLNPITFLILLFCSYLLLVGSSGYETIILRLLLVIPFGGLVYLLLTQKSALSRLFEHKIFLFLGTISYSMYIGHTALIDGMHLIFKPTSALTNLLFLLIAAVVFLLVSYAFHLIIETPYFMFKPEKKFAIPCIQNNKIIFSVLLLTIAFIFFSTYTSQFNFFSLQKKYSNTFPSTTAISDTPYSFTFTAQEDNMGVILIHLTNTVGHEVKKQVSNPLVQQRLQIRMKESGATGWYASQDASPAEIGDSSSYPLGFPVIEKAKNKKYIVELVMKDIDYRSTVILNKDTYDLITVHQIPKQTLIKNPLKLLSHISEKVQTAFANPEAQLVAICITPFFLLLFSL